jgi:Predicted transcriptional regulator
MSKEILELDQKVMATLNSLAQGMNQTPEGVVTALIDGLAKHRQSDDDALLAECDARMRTFRANRRGVPLDEVIEWVDSWLTDTEMPAPQCRVL